MTTDTGNEKRERSKIQEEKPCIFCKLQSKENILFESEYCFAFYDGFPVSPGHVLIVPKRHIASFFDLTKEEHLAVLDAITYIKNKLDEVHHPDGYNIGVNINEAAGQSVFHCHIHVIPRYTGDMENPRGGVRGVIPQKQNY